ncbi:DASH complex subunit Spc19 [Annulohypoxylon maeteangense]|uniref:DASH complex subunit Spc19 n=1 Tax=Annulohypoxylon maeteangense TaxID=1927788 RepID=UPI0020082B32|nr:DASH complex subunit Spc19 [Annulohypoxylon maeteangense]KAI0883935.1 DASH complex subunit Spc19 [Annulohypoxylon maeteangense]
MATTTTSTNSASYGDCVAALRTSLSFLESSVSTLGTGISDFPRLVNVLKSVRHYELIPQPTLVAAESSLRDEIGPAITTLLDRADTHVERVERRIESLKAKSELQQGRLLRSSSPTPPRSTNRNAGKATSTSSSYGGGRRASLPGDRLTVETKLRARQREALQYSVERIELEVLQKERELRKRLDAAA